MESQYINEILSFFDLLIKSDLFKMGFTTLVSAFFGAYGAQRLSEKNKVRKEQLDEIHNINSGIVISYSIGSYCLSFKNDYANRVYKKFNEDLHSLNKDSKQSNIEYNLQTPPKLEISTKLLQRKILNEMHTNEVAISLLLNLFNSINLLNLELISRKEIIKEISNAKNKEIKHELFFGLKNSDDDCDLRNKNNIENIFQYTNDCIFFSVALCKVLNKIGNESKNHSNIKIIEKAFAKAYEKKYVPDHKEYLIRFPSLSEIDIEW